MAADPRIAVPQPGLQERVVRPLYLMLLHANFLDLEGSKREEFAQAFRSAVDLVTDDDLVYLLRCPWREALTGGWLAGALRSSKHQLAISEALLESRTCFAGQGYCFALARCGDEKAASTLVAYLERYLPVGLREYDQRWAAAALSWLDEKHRTNRLARFLDPPLWDVTAHGRALGHLDPAPTHERFPLIMSTMARLLGE